MHTMDLCLQNVKQVGLTEKKGSQAQKMWGKGKFKMQQMN